MGKNKTEYKKLNDFENDLSGAIRCLQNLDEFKKFIAQKIFSDLSVNLMFDKYGNLKLYLYSEYAEGFGQYVEKSIPFIHMELNMEGGTDKYSKVLFEFQTKVMECIDTKEYPKVKKWLKNGQTTT